MNREIYFQRRNSNVFLGFEGYVPQDLNDAWELAKRLSLGDHVAVTELRTNEPETDSIHYAQFVNGQNVNAASRHGVSR
jgi:hypothetical protein